MDIRHLDRRAQAFAAEIIAQVRPERLSVPTPCPDWTLYGLLRHIVSQNEGFAAAARGEETHLSQWRNGRIDGDPRGAYERSAALVDEAFGAEGVLEAKFSLPEVRDGGRFPAAVAIGFHLVDTVVHAWDVAASIGAAWRPDEELVAASLAIALKVPDTPADRGPGLAFEPAIDASSETPDRDRLLALLGRSPDWRPPA
ncbi:TIGR03086 family metal-binding protein [Actinoallomurus vinaceus]